MYQGGCLCGAVQFEIQGTISDIVCCHCSRCRKVQGSAFATNGNVEGEKFVLTQGENKLSAYESTKGQKKYFCKTCGSPIMSKSESAPGKVRVRLGTIDSDIVERPASHIFVGSKANWEEITGDLPQYEESAPDPGK